MDCEFCHTIQPYSVIVYDLQTPFVSQCSWQGISSNPRLKPPFNQNFAKQGGFNFQSRGNFLQKVHVKTFFFFFLALRELFFVHQNKGVSVEGGFSGGLLLIFSVLQKGYISDVAIEWNNRNAFTVCQKFNFHPSNDYVLLFLMRHNTDSS